MSGKVNEQSFRVTGSLRPDEEPGDARDFWTLGGSVALVVGVMAAFAWILQ